MKATTLPLAQMEKKIAFACKPEGEDLREIYTMDADGKNVKRLTTTNFECRDPSWRPDGSEIIFVATNEDTTFFNPWSVTPASGKFGSIPAFNLSSPAIYHPKTSDLYYSHYAEAEDGSSRKALFVFPEIKKVQTVFRMPSSEKYEVESCAISWDGAYIAYIMYDSESNVNIVAMELIQPELRENTHRFYISRDSKDFGAFPAVQSLCVANGGKFVVISALTERENSRATLFMLQGDKRIQLTNGK
ncbi:hypothetical protein QPK87_30755 [Kamptonema cortianum]|nr:hypothetical protein [Kamptonema cortianum]